MKENKDLEHSSIKSHRDQIDKIDIELLELLIQRTDLASDLVKFKEKHSLPVFNPDREMKVINELIQRNAGRISDDSIRFIYNKLFEESKKSAISINHSSKNIWQEIKSTSPLIIAGPCAVESRESIMSIAENLSELGVRFLRGGSFKARTSPTSFQGLGLDGIKILKEAAEKYNMLTITELLSTDQLINLYDYVDIVQIGSRSMSSYSFIKDVGKITAINNKPVLLKRGFSSSITEFLKAADYIRQAGNDNIILCLRGIRTFEQIDSEMRFTPDLATILELKEKTDLPIIFDVAHSAGVSKFIPKMSKAALAMGADGLMFEVHENPQKAKSDGKQSITPNQLKDIILDM